MNLFLHIGTEKTGSSYLQKTCATNRDFLLEKGFYFPGAGRDEQRLLAGSISPGNARELTDLILKKAWEQVSKWLKSRVYDAQTAESEQLLLSNENLVAAFAEQGQVEEFEAVAARCGIRRINALLLIRDPVDQAVSLYKHRAKNGKAGSLEHWVQSSYKLPQHLCGFLEQVESSAISLAARKYIKKSEQLSEIFFSDWLSIDTPTRAIESWVNPSLTLSELRLLKSVATIRPVVTPIFYRQLLEVPMNKKARAPRLETSARQVVENHLCQFNELWARLSLRLAQDGGINIPSAHAGGKQDDANIAFSDEQVMAIAKSIESAMSIRSRASAQFRRIVKSATTSISARLKKAGK